MVAVDAGRRIRGEGQTDESVWRDWLTAAPPPVAAIDDILKAAQRLVVVSPHPDDEVLACGGLVAMHVQRGGSTSIVAVTDGEASHRDDPRWPPARLAAARRSERRLGLARLGVGPDSVADLALPDGAVASRAEALSRHLKRLLRAGDCVVTTWRLDGHPDHDATGAACASACGAIGCKLVEAPVWMWHWAMPADPRVPWHRMRALALATDTIERKTAALAAHATQFSLRADAAPVLGRAIRARSARSAEYFIV